ncbi:MAG: helix-turn-helix domain-containing protein [Clostridia bacterium]|nr:helix-turn-helix domain-containing protein [Clostridia bacterium]
MKKLKTLSTNIKKYRFSLGITQEELAQKLFVTPQAVSKWETGTALPDVENLIKLADIFSMSADRLLGREDVADEDVALIAVDGGGTKTEFILFSPDGTVMKRLVLGSTNPNIVGIENCCQVLAQGIDSLLIKNPSSEQIFLGIAGAKSGSNGKLLTSFVKKTYPFLDGGLDSDILNIIWSSGDDSDCIAAICGTGSVVYAWHNGKLTRSGGWGYLFDGAGSGFDIGREAICACLAKDDGIGSPSLVTESVEEKLEGKAFDKIDVLYSKGKDFIASFAPLVFDAYEKGDRMAEEIIRKSADRIAFLINEQCRRYQNLDKVVISGGIIRAGGGVYKNFIEEKMEQKIPIIVPELPPIYGACLKCLSDFSGTKIPETFEENFKRTYSKASDL